MGVQIRRCHLAEVNDFKPPKFNVTIPCEHVSPEVFRKWPVNLEVINVFDMDCQGYEYELFRKSLIFSSSRFEELLLVITSITLSGLITLFLLVFRDGCQYICLISKAE
jgi:hypothetical protein